MRDKWVAICEAQNMTIAEVRPTVAEWGALPNVLQDALVLVRIWAREMEVEAQKQATRRGPG